MITCSLSLQDILDQDARRDAQRDTRHDAQDVRCEVRRDADAMLDTMHKMHDAKLTRCTTRCILILPICTNARRTVCAMHVLGI